MSWRRALGSGGGAGLLGIALSLTITIGARAEVTRYGPFTVDSDTPGIIHLSGDIGLDAANAFRAAMVAFPDLTVLTLDSNGGATFVAAAIGAEVSRHGLATAVLAGDGCFSACPLIFFAGPTRLAIGALGVHQVSFPRGSPLDAEDVQLGVARYIEVLVSLDLDPEIILAALGTPPDRMHVFTRAEVDAWGVQNEPDAVLALLGLGPLPERAEAIATIEEAFASLLADEDRVRAVMEADGGPLTDEAWGAVRTMLHAALLHPASGEYLLNVIESEGISLDTILAEDAAELGPFVTTFGLNLTSGGLLRLPLADQEAYVGYVRRALEWLVVEHPETCSDEAAVMSGSISGEYLGSLDEPELKDYLGLTLRAIDAEMTQRAPEVTSNDTRRFGAEIALGEAIAEVAREHPRGAELMMPDPGEPTDFCLYAEIVLAAVDTLPSDLRADTIMLMFEPAPYE